MILRALQQPQIDKAAAAVGTSAAAARAAQMAVERVFEHCLQVNCRTPSALLRRRLTLNPKLRIYIFTSNECK